MTVLIFSVNASKPLIYINIHYVNDSSKTTMKQMIRWLHSHSLYNSMGFMIVEDNNETVHTIIMGTLVINLTVCWTRLFCKISNIVLANFHSSSVTNIDIVHIINIFNFNLHSSHLLRSKYVVFTLTLPL